ncbi:MAG TPA: VIT1/CCC1 transporter family protein [Steroidobacteraceae bacterium]|nr:VIT1/CCC1 transporter family protein [Steroidobacteraceae bacterium]
MRESPLGSEQASAQHEKRRLMRHWIAEHDSAELYGALARFESDPAQSRIYQDLAAAERTHASFWERRLRAAGHSLPTHRPSLRTRLLIELARRFGTGFVAPTITVREMRDRDHYASLGDADALALAYDEQAHAAVMRSRTRGAFGNNLRAAVLGANDGVASNFCLMMGVAGGGARGATVLLSGVAGLIGGACAMALGEWLSVTNARELAISQMERELGRSTAALDGGAADELPAGNARSAATLSFCLFALGAAVPLASFCLLTGRAAIAGSALGSLAALFVLGLTTSLFNGRSALFSGARQATIGAAAAAVTFIAGRLFDALHGSGP